MEWLHDDGGFDTGLCLLLRANSKREKEHARAPNDRKIIKGESALNITQRILPTFGLPVAS
jgi:hypothetical protein